MALFKLLHIIFIELFLHMWRIFQLYFFKWVTLYLKIFLNVNVVTKMALLGLFTEFIWSLFNLFN